jgi:hypothetical protein
MTAQIATKRCPGCGGRIQPGEQKCEHCGYMPPITRKLAEQEGWLPTPTKTPTRRKTPQSVTVLRIFAALGIFGSIGFFLIAVVSIFTSEKNTGILGISIVTMPIAILTGALLLAVADIVETLISIESKLAS